MGYYLSSDMMMVIPWDTVFSLSQCNLKWPPNMTVLKYDLSGGSYSERGLFTASMISYDIGSFFVQLR